MKTATPALLLLSLFLAVAVPAGAASVCAVSVEGDGLVCVGTSERSYDDSTYVCLGAGLEAPHDLACTKSDETRPCPAVWLVPASDRPEGGCVEVATGDGWTCVGVSETPTGSYTGVCKFPDPFGGGSCVGPFDRSGNVAGIRVCGPLP